MLSVTPKEEEQMKTIRIQITDQERQRLLGLRQKSGDCRGERALAVLHCADGRRPRQIADMLKRSSQAVCQWLHAYERDGITGLSKEYSPGRPSTRKTKLIHNLEKYLSRSPRDFGWGEDVWSVKVLMAQFEKENGFPISRYTVIRALNDESHFSADPYVIRGWSKRGQPFFPLQHRQNARGARYLGHTRRKTMVFTGKAQRRAAISRFGIFSINFVLMQAEKLWH